MPSDVRSRLSTFAIDCYPRSTACALDVPCAWATVDPSVSTPQAQPSVPDPSLVSIVANSGTLGVRQARLRVFHVHLPRALVVLRSRRERRHGLDAATAPPPRGTPR